MRKQLRWIILLSGLLNSFLADAQTIPPRLDSVGQKLTNSLSGYNKRYPQEKIFIHTDQNIYLGGQALWYKTYLLAYGKPSLLSKIVYVRLSDAQGKLIKQDKLPLKNSTAYGNISLSDTLHTGWYQLQAFTTWMLNFDEGDFYHQNIYIQNIHDRANQTFRVSEAKTYHINFYPEGGDLVDGNICNVAFKATDENGLPARVYGDVLSKNKRSIAKLTTVHDGMGSFELEASANVNYTAQVHLPDSTVQYIALPKVKKTGISMRVNASVNELEVRMTYSDRRLEHQDIILEAVQNNGLSVTYPLKLIRGINVFSLKKDDFSTGILRLTIFDENGVPGAERIVFINKYDLFKLSLVKDTLSYNAKGKNVFTLNLKDNKDQPAKANLSIAVTDAAIGSEPEDHICSYFLMSSELSGRIYQPGYYLKNNSDTLQKQLDLVMLTNGWRHFKWDTVFKAQPRVLKYFVESTQVIAGQIENYHDKDNLRIKLMITNADSSKKIVFIAPDSTGCFVLKDYDRQGTANMYFEVVNAKNKKQSAKIAFFKQDVDTIHFGPDTLSTFAKIKPVVKNAFLDHIITGQNARFVTQGIALKTVNIKERKLTPTELVIKNHVKNFDLDDSSTLDLVNTPSLPGVSIINYIQGKFPGLQIYISPDGSTYVFKYRGSSNLSDANSLPFFYLDEAQVSLGDIENISLQDIALIRFAPPPVWFAPTGGGFIGAILVYTKTYGDDKGTSSSGTFDRYTFNGYSLTREFSLPDYSIDKQARQPDYRTTLYWNHDLTTDSLGNFKIQFYNSDQTKKYRVVVQGMDANGRMGYLSAEF
ncbi:MAG: hypothetical protein JWP78_1389 [Mucilaginibacter sp.]|nr:hypothetical protein [Mucilaginibacter sp.]